MRGQKPDRSTASGRAYLDLRNLARRHSRDLSEYLTLYALEGFLARLAVSEQASAFVLKGGVLMAAFAARRPTRDIDLASRGVPADIDEVNLRARAIVSVETGDGLTFDLDSISGHTIRDDADYPGVRAKIEARLATARIPFHVDVNFGDPIVPGPADTDLPLLLGGMLSLNTYPDHMVLAEKIVTAVDRGVANTRWRDFVDIAAIAATRPVRQTELAHAISVVADHRQVYLTPLSAALEQMPTIAQSRWSVWRRKQALDTSTPELFGDLLDECFALADPAVQGAAGGLIWSPKDRAWLAPAAI